MSHKVEEIYVTIFDKTSDQSRLIGLLEQWGFVKHGIKQTRTNGPNELVYVRNFLPSFSPEKPKTTYPYFSRKRGIFLCSIYESYHTELFPDSILTTESPLDFRENKPHQNALSKVYISRSINRDLTSGDVVIFYRTGGLYKGVITTIGIIENTIDKIESEDEFVLKCRKRSVFTDKELKEHWNWNSRSRPFIVNFIYTYSLPKKLNLKTLIDIGVVPSVSSFPRGFARISEQHFDKIIQESKSDESIVVD